MTPGWKRYGEARLYLIGGSAGLLVILWSLLFAHDHDGPAQEVTAVQENVAGQDSAPARAPQTKTRGS